MKNLLLHLQDWLFEHDEYIKRAMDCSINDTLDSRIYMDIQLSEALAVEHVSAQIKRP